MRKIGILILMVGFLFANTDTDAEIDVFSKKPIAEQNKIIKKHFKVLDKLMAELDGIIRDIDNTRKEIKALQDRDNTCDVLDGLNGDIVHFKSKLSKIKIKNSQEYIKINNSYLDTKKAYALAKQELHCK